MLSVRDVENNSNNEDVNNHENPPAVLIAGQLDGVPAGEERNLQHVYRDKITSRTYGASVYTRYEDGQFVGQIKNTDDKIVIGYTSDGLPFQIVVDGSPQGATEATFSFISKYVIPLMDDYAEKLSQSENAELTIKALIKQIYKLRNQHAVDAEFTMSIGITYERDHHLKCAGFGIGNTGLILNRSNGKIDQLTLTTSVNKCKDAFDNRPLDNAGVKRVIKRNSIFDVTVQPGDELLGYTCLMPELLVEAEVKTDVYNVVAQGVAQEQTDTIVKSKLAAAPFDYPEDSLFDVVKRENEKAFLAKCRAVEECEVTEQFGDDFMLGSVIIPSKNYQNELSNIVFQQEKTRLSKSLENENADMQAKGQRVLDAADNAASEDNLPRLTRDLVITSKALINPTEQNLNVLVKRAKAAEGSSSWKIKCFGIALMILGAGAMAVGGLLITAGMGAAFTGVLVPAGLSSIVGGAALIAAGSGVLGLGLFAYREGCQQGMSKSMNHVAQAKKAIRV